MKIVCDNCATKYSIADEKVRGKVFKIRCKKCSHIIVVKGTEGADAPADAAAADAAPADAEPAGEGWHVVINGEQVGPLSSSEVRSKFSGGEIDAETFAWKEGFGDWQRLASIDEFRDLQAAPATDSTRRSGSPTADDLFGGGETTTGNNDLFGSSPSGDLFAGSPSPAAAPAPSGGAGLFAQPAAAEAPRRAPTPGFGQPAVDTAPPAQQAAPPAAASGGKGLTGQRNENSVLFSLNNLQALASGGPANKPSQQAASSGGGVDNRPGFANSQTEGSGLIDIRAMAAATLSSPSQNNNSSNNDLPAFSSAPVFSPIAAPILMPAAASGPPKWLWPVVGVGGLAFFAMIAVLVLVLTKKEPVAVAPPAAAPVAAPVAGAPAAAAAPAPGATAPAATTPAAAGTPAAAVAAATPAAAAHPAKNSAPGGKSSKAERVPGTKVAKADSPAAAAPSAEPAPAPAPKKKSGGGDDLDALLNGAAPDKPSRSSSHADAPAASDDNLPEQLDKGAIVTGMGGVKPKVNDCYHQFNVPGMANVAVTIVKAGRISNASVTGAFAGTPTGDCVAKAVKTASFPKFKGAPQSITYPFMLR